MGFAEWDLTFIIISADFVRLGGLGLGRGLIKPTSPPNPGPSSRSGFRPHMVLPGREVAQAAVASFGVVVVDIPCDALAHVSHGRVGMQVYILIFERVPEAFNPMVVKAAPSTVHAYLYAKFLQGLYP